MLPPCNAIAATLSDIVTVVINDRYIECHIQHTNKPIQGRVEPACGRVQNTAACRIQLRCPQTTIKTLVKAGLVAVFSSIVQAYS